MRDESEHTCIWYKSQGIQIATKEIINVSCMKTTYCYSFLLKQELIEPDVLNIGKESYHCLQI